MKKLSINKNDSSFENKHKFNDLLKRVKALGGSIIKNGAETCTLAFLVGCLLFSTSNIYNYGKDVINAVDYYITVSQMDDTISSQNDEEIRKLNEEAILATNISAASEEANYYFQDQNLHDKDGNIVLLDNIDKPIYFIKCALDCTTLENIHLSSSKTEILALDYSSIDDSFINYLPSSLKALSLSKCHFITNLNGLANRCPNIEAVCINAAAGLTDLSFIYNLPNLSELYISDSAYITAELLDYLKEKNISTNLTDQDLKNSQKIDDIISKIITPEMNDREKIQAVSLYVLNNVTYDIHQSLESNDNPLSCVLEDGKGVCTSYAYLTSVLLNKAGVKSFNVVNSDHAWTMVKVDDKYYYFDTTNMDGSMVYNFLLKILNITKYYMVDTNSTFTTAMSSPQNEATMIPVSLIKDIEAGRSNKDLFEKYGGQIGNIGVLLGSVLSGLSIALVPYLLPEIKYEAQDLFYYIKEDYKKEMDEKRPGPKL